MNLPPRTCSRRLLALVVVAVGLACICDKAAHATDRFWNVASGSISTASNWSPNGVPGSSDTGFINNGGTATLSSGAVSPNKFVIGETGSGTAVINGGELTVGNGSIFVGGENGSGTGVMTVSGATTHVSSGDDFQLGRVGTGTLNILGGRVQGYFTVVGKFGTGLWNQSGGIFDQIEGDIEIGDGGRPDQSGMAGPRTGTINLSGGVLYGKGHLAIGNRVGGGEVKVSGGALAMTGDPNGTGTIFVGRGMDWGGHPGEGAATTFRVTGGNSIIVANGGLNMNESGVASSSTLVAEITGLQHTTIKVEGDAKIANGSLKVELNGYTPIAGDSWTLIQAGADISTELAAIDTMVSGGGFPALTHIPGSAVGTVIGEFAGFDYSMASLNPGLSWDVGYVNNSVILSVIGPAGLVGDYNDNLVVDAADYTVWRDTLGSTSDLRADGDTTGASANKIDQADYLAWKNNFGASSGAAAIAATAPVPEPTTAVLIGVACAALVGGHFRRTR